MIKPDDWLMLAATPLAFGVAADWEIWKPVFEEADTDVLEKNGSRRVELAPALDRDVYVPGRRRAEEGDDELGFPGMDTRTPAVQVRTVSVNSTTRKRPRTFGGHLALETPYRRGAYHVCST
jgi:hypothetical protein